MFEWHKEKETSKPAFLSFIHVHSPQTRNADPWDSEGLDVEGEGGKGQLVATRKGKPEAGWVFPG